MNALLQGVAIGIALAAAAAAGYGTGTTRTHTAAVPDSAFAVSKSGVSLFRVNVDGNVGVGTSDPQARFHTNGALRADGVVASSTGGFQFPDATTQTTAAPKITFYQRAASYGLTQPSSTYAVHCDAGDAPTGGGFRAPAAVTGSYTTSTGWVVEFTGPVFLANPMVVYVVCAHSVA